MEERLEIKLFREENSYYPLHEAVRCGKTNVVRELIKNGANCNQLNDESHSPADVAARCGKFEILKLLIENEAIIRIETFGHAYLGNNTELMQYLAKNYKETFVAAGISDLHLAVWNNDTTSVKSLTNQNCNIYQCDKYGFTPMMLACEFGKHEVIRYLVENKLTHLNAVVFGKNHLYNGVTLAWLLAERKEWDLLRELAANAETINFNAAPLDKYGRKGVSIIDLLNIHCIKSVQTDNFETIKFMVGHGANVYFIDKENRAALHHAVTNLDHARELIPYFLDQKLNIDAQDSDDKTPLYHIAEYFSLEEDSDKKAKAADIIRLLVAYGANRFLEEKNGKTVFDLQEKCDELSIHLKTDLDIELDKYVFDVESESLIKNLFYEKYNVEDQILINGKNYNINIHLVECLTNILNHNKTNQLFLQKSQQNTINEILNSYKETRYQDKDAPTVNLLDATQQTLERLFYGLTKMNTMISSKQISHYTKDNMNFDINVKYIPACKKEKGKKQTKLTDFWLNKKKQLPNNKKRDADAAQMNSNNISTKASYKKVKFT